MPSPAARSAAAALLNSCRLATNSWSPGSGTVTVAGASGALVIPELVSRNVVFRPSRRISSTTPESPTKRPLTFLL